MRRPELPQKGDWVLYRPRGKTEQVRVKVDRANHAWIYILKDGPDSSPSAAFHSQCATLAGQPFG